MTQASHSRAVSLSYRQAFMLTLKRDLVIAFRHKDEMINPLLFFVIVITLFPLGIGPQPNTLAKIAPGIVWVCALLATLLSLDRLFKADHSDGSLEQMLISPQPLFIFTLAKITAHWLLTGLPLILIAPLLAVLLHLPEQSYSALMLTLLLGTPVLSFIGAIGAALTVGIKKGGGVIEPDCLTTVYSSANLCDECYRYGKLELTLQWTTCYNCRAVFWFTNACTFCRWSRLKSEY